VGNITKQERQEVAKGIPCRVYQNTRNDVKMNTSDSTTSSRDMLACANSVDIRAGDELFILRGGKLGQKGLEKRYFAGEPAEYFEPFGGVKPRIAHQQIPLSGESRVKVR